ncbi:MAG: thioredoxin domain-containing protein [Nanoarchaeota archaeon]
MEENEDKKKLIDEVEDSEKKSDIKEEKEKKVDGEKKDFIEKVRENPWMISTAVLGFLFLGFLVGGVGFTGSAITGGVVGVSADVAVENFEIFASSKGIDVEVNDVTEEDGLYLVSFSTQEGDSFVYISKDGKNLVSGLIPLTITDSPTTNSQTASVSKSDKPVVELFVWGYCPYGVQAQGPLAEVAFLLGDYADFKSVLYYDGHGEYETQQNKIQECLQEVDSEKYWEYVTGFVEDIYPKCSSSRDVDCDKTESVNLMKSLGIDSKAVLACVDSRGEDLLGEASSSAKELGVTGSPTLVVNGVKVNVARTSEAYKQAVCEAFSEAPEECSEVLDSSEVAAAGNC